MGTFVTYFLNIKDVAIGRHMGYCHGGNICNISYFECYSSPYLTSFSSTLTHFLDLRHWSASAPL